MTPELLERVFIAVSESAPHQRRTRLAELCQNDSRLANEVLSLLSAAETAGNFLGRSPASRLGHDAVNGIDYGHSVGGYRLVRQLGRGGMSSVYMAQPQRAANAKTVAIKILSQWINGEAELQRFRIERQILADLKHPNIARFVDGGETVNGQAYLVMEYVPGLPITEYCHTNDLTVREILQLFCKVCDAVAYAHKRHIVHRDLKPANILVTAQGQPKLLDFGIAKLLHHSRLISAQPQTLAGMLLLTPEYAAPEQISGAPIGVSADIYSLGVILYELLTGIRPHDLTGIGLPDLAKYILHSEIQPPSKKATSAWRAQLRGDLDAVVRKSLRIKPQHRYQTVLQLRDDLRCYLAGLPLRAKHGWGYGVGRLWRHWAVNNNVILLAIAIADDAAVLLQLW